MLSATRPETEIEYAGWLLRLARNDVKRASSVNVVGASTLPLYEKIEHCERVYGEQDQPPLFRLTDIDPQLELDEALNHRGYERFEESIAMVAPLGATPVAARQDLRFESRELSQWLDVACTLRGVPEDRKQAEAMRLSRSAVDPVAILAVQQNETVACGLMIVEDGYAGLFDIEAAPAYRRQGAALALCRHLLQQGRASGAEKAWLSVVSTNEPAIRLYEKLGFTPLYRYWYRRQRSASA